jgi:hypothetical protein
MHSPPMAGHSNEGARYEGDCKPDLSLIGAMMSGTTCVRKLLSSRPAILMFEPGGPSYFVFTRQIEVIWRVMWARGF